MTPRLRQVQICNYRSIGRAVVDLEPFTVLVGANGSGKSNFLASLGFVKSCLLDSPAEAARSQGGGTRMAPRWESLYSRTGFRFRLDLGDRHCADYAFEVAFDPSGAPLVTHELCRVESAGREQVFEVAEGEFKREIPGIRAQIQPDRLGLAVASATEEFRPVYDFLTGMQLYSINPASLHAARPTRSGPLEFSGENAAQVLTRLAERLDAYERLNQLLSRAVPGLRKVQSRKLGDRLGIEFVQDVGKEYPETFDAWEMSDGTLRLLGLLLAIYQPQRPSLVAIEEPEATVHPAVAELVLQVLLDAAEDRQVLITTHSPDILDAKELSDEQIRVVTMAHGRTSIAPLAQASRQAIREHLYTPGELLRSNELNQDAAAAAEAAERLDLFAAAVSHTGK
ncbi:MAG TPA: AAA family ATPase [Thermoanaerobaculia bacterium]|nr:AAA family ATPase [Thermoanaerobaculia bacterium]